MFICYVCPSLQSNLMEGGYNALKSYPKTRFNFILLMLQSIENAMDGLRELLRGGEKFSLLYVLDTPFLTETIQILEPFNAATLALSASKHPTLHLKIPIKMKLIFDLDTYSTRREFSNDGKEVRRSRMTKLIFLLSFSLTECPFHS